MGEKRKIRADEQELILFLLDKLGLDPENYPIREYVDEYEDGVMGSIGLGNSDAIYDGDLIQVQYIDTDTTPVVITLTKDTRNQLLDLDFWKVDFSRLLSYPTPQQLILPGDL